MKIYSFLTLTAIAALAAVTGCKKEAEKSPIDVNYSGSNGASLKVIYTSPYFKRDSVHIKINDARVSNTFLSPTTSNTPIPFPGGGLNTGGSNFPDYFLLAPGDTKIAVAIPKLRTNEDSIVKFTGNVTLDAGKKYSAFIADTAANSRIVLVPESGVAPADSTVSVFKFVNLIPNQPAIDLYFKNVLVSGNIAYGAYSPEFTLPSDSTGQWAIRIAGAAPASAAIVTYPTGTTNQTIPKRRIMTVFCKGYTGAAAPRLPVISLIYN